MRQHIALHCLVNRRTRKLAAVVAFLLMGMSTLLADIGGLSLTVSSNPPQTAGRKLNGGALVTLNAVWTKGDTPPFAATFLGEGDVAIGTVNTTSMNANFQIGAASLGQGEGKNFGVRVIETSKPNAISESANGNKSVDIDLSAPTIEVNITPPTGGSFSNVAPNNKVSIVVRCTDKQILEPTFTVTPNNGLTVENDPGNSAPGNTFRYTVTLNTAAAGVYTVRAVGKDTTLPENTANSSAGQSSFNVNLTGPQAPTITEILPGSPTKSPNISVKGKASAGTVRVELYDGTTKVGETSVAGEDWQISLSGVAEGEHIYTVRGYDNIGNTSGSSANFKGVIDTTLPNTPVLEPSPSPTNAATVTIRGSNATDKPGAGGVVSNPVYASLFRADNLTDSIASATANSDGSFTFSGVPLSVGENRFVARSEDSARGSPGNQSGYSNSILIMRDDAGSTVRTVTITRAPIVSQALPFPSTRWLGAGNYTIDVTFNKDMDSATKPNIAFTPAGGGEVVSNSGSWTASTTYSGTISIPAAQGDSYDGAAKVRIFGAKDTAGNTMTEYVIDPAFSIDTTAPTTTMDSMDTIFVASNTTTVQVTGRSTDARSGVGVVELIVHDFAGTSSTTYRVPLFNGTDAPWSYPWNTGGLAPGQYKVWARAIDQAEPTANVEQINPANFRRVVVARDGPSVDRISLDDLSIDINAMDSTTTTPTIASAVTKLTGKVVDGGGSGIDFGSPNFIFTVAHNGGTAIPGNYTNNGSDTVFYTFPQLNVDGTYTVRLQPVDKAGNPGALATRSFILKTAGPASATVMPPTGTYANPTSPPLAADQVWGVINDPFADFTRSKIEVSYNGSLAGSQLVNGSTTAVVWDILGPTATLPQDQSYDGRWDVIVTPRDLLGNTGDVIRSHFFYDSVPPAVTKFEPNIDKANPGSASWFGLSTTQMSVTVSDAPKDNKEFFSSLGIAVRDAQDQTWNNGPGSGVDIATSSLTMTPVGGSTASGTSSGANQIVIPRPGIPGSDVGVLFLNMRVETADRVNEGQSIPNRFHMDYAYGFDYLRPEVSFSASRVPAKSTARIPWQSKDWLLTKARLTKSRSWLLMFPLMADRPGRPRHRSGRCPRKQRPLPLSSISRN
jgi:hypothetical protein